MYNQPGEQLILLLLRTWKLQKWEQHQYEPWRRTTLRWKGFQVMEIFYPTHSTSILYIFSLPVKSRSQKHFPTPPLKSVGLLQQVYQQTADSLHFRTFNVYLKQTISCEHKLSVSSPQCSPHRNKHSAATCPHPNKSADVNSSIFSQTWSALSQMPLISTDLLQ